MPRPATGQIVERRGKDGRTYRSIRFRAYGTRRTHPLGVVSREEAEKALEHTMADVERGLWKPPTPAEAPPEPTPLPDFHTFADSWWVLHEGQLDKGTKGDYKRRLENHLIPYFGEMRLDQITYAVVERFMAETKPLLAGSTLNKHLALLAKILNRAVKLGLIDHNPAKDEDLRVLARRRPKSYLDSAGQITALLDAAGELDRNAPEKRKHIERRALLAVLIFAGLRHEEALALRWRDVRLADGWLDVHGTKTDQADRKVKIRGALRDELLALRQRHEDVPQSALVFPSSTGARLSQSNVGERILGRPARTVKDKKTGEDKPKPASGAVAVANTRLEAAGLPPLPEKLEIQSMRVTFCSLLYAIGEEPGVVMDEMGHTDPALALRIYRQPMRREEKAKLRALVEGADWANMGERVASETPARTEREAA